MNNFKAKEERPGGLPDSSQTLGPASDTTGARAHWTLEGGGGRAGRAPGAEGTSRSGARAKSCIPRPGAGTPRPEGCTCGSGAGGRRQGGWLSRVEARRTPIPAACSRRGLQRAHRSHRRRLGFIYPDGRARPGNRNTEAFSCFLTARPSRRTSCGRGIHVPGPARGSLSTLPAAGTSVNPRRRAAAASAAGEPPASPRPAESSTAGPGPQIRRPRRRRAKGVISFALRGEIREAASSARLRLWDLRSCGANPAS